MKPIWTPESDAAIREIENRKAAAWQAIYDSNPEVKKLADEIHSQRMLTPPACSQCIEIAVRRLEKQGVTIPRPNENL
jgi:hypothetical protein